MRRWLELGGRAVRRDLWALLATAAAVAVLLAPLWAFRSLPSQDGPDHVYNARLFLRLAVGGADEARPFYELHIDAFPNWFSHAALAALMTVLPPLMAEKLLLTAYALALPLSFRYALAGIRPEAARLAWLVLPFTFNKWLHEGFFNRSFALVPFLLAIGWSVRRRSRWRARDGCVLALLALAAYFCTLASVVVLAGSLAALALAFLLSARRSGVPGRLAWRAPLVVAAALTPALALVVRFQMQQRGEVSGMGPPLSERARYLFSVYDAVAYDRIETWIAGALAAALLLAIVAALARRLQERRARWEDALLSTTLAIAAAYFLVPAVSIPGVRSEPLQYRLGLHVHVAMLLWLAPALSLRAGRRLVAVAMLATVGLLAARWPYYGRLNELVDDQTSVADAIPSGAVFLPLSFDHEGDGGARRPIPADWIVGPLRHAGSRVAVRRELVSVDNYQADTLHFPLRYRPGANANELLNSRLDGSPGCVRLGHFNRRAPRPIEYVLVFRRALAPGDACTLRTLGYLDRHYEPVAASASGSTQLLRLRGIGRPGPFARQLD